MKDLLVFLGFFVFFSILVRFVWPVVEQAVQVKEPPAPPLEPDDENVGWQRPTPRRPPPPSGGSVDSRALRMIIELEKAEGRTPAERETFLAKAAELRRRHGL